jgi:hypothetical protein
VKVTDDSKGQRVFHYLYIGREKFYDTGPIIEMIKEHPGDIAQDYITVFEIFSQKIIMNQ